MPSPFPGMDPYIEQPDIWPGFHNGLAYEIQSQLNAVLPDRYFATLTPRLVYEVVDTGKDRGVVPDVGIRREPARGQRSETAVAVLAFTPATAESSLPIE